MNEEEERVKNIVNYKYQGMNAERESERVRGCYN